jgi:hypothetical protein
MEEMVPDGTKNFKPGKSFPVCLQAGKFPFRLTAYLPCQQILILDEPKSKYYRIRNSLKYVASKDQSQPYQEMLIISEICIAKQF